jgi:hypothetical protein
MTRDITYILENVIKEWQMSFQDERYHFRMLGAISGWRILFLDGKLYFKMTSSRSGWQVLLKGTLA